MNSTRPDTWPAPAKLNLFLHILGRRDDGYHELQTVFQFLDLSDGLRFIPRDDGRLERRGGLAGVADADDLVIRAARLLREHSGRHFGVTIEIDKRIPAGGGLGGGSSDAATTLVALNRLHQLGLEQSELLELGVTLGADVPVFVRGHAAFAEGLGERLSDVNVDQPWYLVVDPGVSVPTVAMYAAPELRRDCPPVSPRGLDIGACGNVFEPVVLARYPPVAALFQWLAGHGRPRLTGSGGCVFIAFATRDAARRVLERLPGDWTGFVTRGCNRSALCDRLAG